MSESLLTAFSFHIFSFLGFLLLYWCTSQHSTVKFVFVDASINDVSLYFNSGPGATPVDLNASANYTEVTVGSLEFCFQLWQSLDSADRLAFENTRFSMKELNIAFQLS